MAPVCYSTSGNSITNGNSEDGDDGDTDGADDGEQLGCWPHFRHTTVIVYGQKETENPKYEWNGEHFRRGRKDT